MPKDKDLKEVDLKEDVIPTTEVPPPPTTIRHVVRTLGAMTNNQNVLSGDDLNSYLNGWFAQGWRLFATHVLGQSPDGINILYVLLKN